MSMDIRSFFGSPGRDKQAASSSSTKHNNGKGKRKHDDDDGDFARFEKKQRHSAKPTKMKKSNIIYDSDTDEEDPKPKKTKTSKGPTKLPEPTPEKKKATSAIDFFGSSPVQRSVKKPARKVQPISNGGAKKPRLENEEHDDEDFQATLRMMDEDKSPLKEDKPAKGKGLASKLAAKVKAGSLVPDTPDREKQKEKSRYTEPTIQDTPSGSRQQSRISTKEDEKASPEKRVTRSTPTKPPPTKRAPIKSTTKAKLEITSPPKRKEDARSKVETSTSPPGGEGEKRRGSAGYKSYLNREGPRSLGSREEPKGADGCLSGLTFVLTGVLEYFDKDQIKAIIEQHGGRLTTSISKKTTHLVIGREPGESKVAKAQEFRIKQIQEEELYEMIETRPGKGGSKVKGKGQAPQQQAKKQEETKPERMIAKPETPSMKPYSKDTAIKKEPSSHPSTSTSSLSSSSSSNVSKSGQSSKPASGGGQSAAGSLMWVDKYKPVSTKTIIGQQGDKSNAKKLLIWLRRWNDNNYGNNKEKAKFNRDAGFAFKAALLSGPPGVGKTTTATLVCQELGFSFIEQNASDSRGKKSLQGGIAESLDNQSISDMFKKGCGKKTTEESYKHCLIMDEVDGVAGNEDRGGIQELIQMIKTTRTPIICICNDRSHPKIRSLVNYCFDLRFQRPRVPQIKAAMMSIAYKEGLTLPPASLEGMIMAANQDVRQVLHNLSMWSAGQKKMNAEQMNTDARNAKKDLKLGPWDVARQVFSSKDLKTMSFNDKMDLFFHDYSIAGLFVQENYLHVIPDEGRGDIKKQLDLVSKAADSMCQSDLVEKAIRTRNCWRLLPTQAVFASVIPGTTMQGYMGGMINFPSWLGKNSTRGKNFRLLQELQVHMRKSTSASIRSLNQEYLPRLRKFLTQPMIEREADGVPDSVNLMHSYDLLREDFDSLLEVTQYSDFNAPMGKVAPKVKAAFTRLYNKEAHATPYAVDAGGKKKKGKGGGGVAGVEDGLLKVEGEEDEGTQEEEGSDGDDDVSALRAKPKAAGAKGRGGGSKGKAPAKGKAPVKGKGRGRSK